MASRTYSQQPTFQELLQGGITTATHVIEKETIDVYASYVKKFCDFCIANEYPDPAMVRHHKLPSLLVAFMESVSISSAVSNQTAEKIRAAVANYYSSHERRNAAGPDKRMVVTDENGIKRVATLGKHGYVYDLRRIPFGGQGGQCRFMFAVSESRWSLKMVKWWAGWTQNESAETLVRYLLDQAASDEDKQLADCLAPDREGHTGVPTTFTGRKRNAASNFKNTSSESSLEKRLKALENSTNALEEKMNTLIAILQPGMSSMPEPSRDRSDCNGQVSILPPEKDWKDLCRIYWKADPSCHLCKPVCEWNHLDKKNSGVLPSRLSVAKLIVQDVLEFTTQTGVADPKECSEATLTAATSALSAGSSSIATREVPTRDKSRTTTKSKGTGVPY
ncbi:unnamed protein product [Phytophthora fragariaefolia]|uniref:Unnamed protein product n=1 Tax=Phytophthora fragariaefolia TaxID=1490495 RepID=A0A9W7CVY4_9STRA|nr:unnamed protein product [Phytophthora fragariaefolia]